MKTCPKCKMSGIPDEAKYCPQCGSPLPKSFLYNGKGRKCENDGLLVVDIRQCERISGLGWDGMYEFGPGLPKGYNGFYAVFDEHEGVQMLVIDGKLDTIFVTDVDTKNSDIYTLKIWRGEKIVSYSEEEGWWIFTETVKKYTSKQVTYYAAYKNDQLITDKIVLKHFETVVENEFLKLVDTYEKEFQDFLGITYDTFNADAEEYTEN